MLRYLEGAGFNNLCPAMLHVKIGQLLDEGTPDYRVVTKYSKALTTSLQHHMKNGESAALLDLYPWGDCDESALVQNYVDSAPFRKKRKKRRQCPIDASVLFRNNGPHITGEENMKAIREYIIHSTHSHTHQFCTPNAHTCRRL